jgi:hypothetical protein
MDLACHGRGKTDEESIRKELSERSLETAEESCAENEECAVGDESLILDAMHGRIKVACEVREKDENEHDAHDIKAGLLYLGNEIVRLHLVIQCTLIFQQTQLANREVALDMSCLACNVDYNAWT